MKLWYPMTYCQARCHLGSYIFLFSLCKKRDAKHKHGRSDPPLCGIQHHSRCKWQSPPPFYFCYSNRERSEWRISISEREMCSKLRSSTCRDAVYYIHDEHLYSCNNNKDADRCSPSTKSIIKSWIFFAFFSFLRVRSIFLPFGILFYDVGLEMSTIFICDRWFQFLFY